MAAIATFARARSGRALVFERSCPDLQKPLLMIDLVGETQSVDLISRLRSVDVVVPPDTVILRGLSPALSEQAVGEADHFLNDFFPSARSVLRADFAPRPALATLGGETPPDTERALLLDQLAQCELESHLAWSDGIWTSPDYHFVLPSGEHANLFVRLSDVFADPIALARLADWKASTITGPTLLLADTPAMLPLLQELRIRSANASEHRHLILPLYSLSPDDAENRLAELMPWCLERRARVAAFISVTSSGGYKQQLDELCKRLPPPNGIDVHVLCEASARKTTPALAHIETKRFASKRECELCRESSSTIEVDTQRFAAQLLVGTKVVDLPQPRSLADFSFLLTQADAERAFRVHVERPLFGRHLGIAIDPEGLLRSRIFSAQATLSLAKVQRDFHPDLVLVPRHDSTSIIQNWLHKEGLPGAKVLPLDGQGEDDLEVAIRRARSILLCDAGMITSRTLRACVEAVQRTKGEADNDFVIKGIVLVARPDVLATWRGISDRLYIKLGHNLEAAWVLSLPDHLSGPDCPWCTELRWLKGLVDKLPSPAREYVEERIGRLTNPDGLTEQIYLGSDLEPFGRDHRAGVHTTPNSYFGDLSDVGMFVAWSAVLQQLRNEWRNRKEFFTTRMALPLPTILRRFTDPIIPAAVLRAAKPSELRAPAILQDLRDSLHEIGHERQHSVLLAELLYGISNHRLPITHRDVDYLDRLSTRQGEASTVLSSIFRSAFAASTGERIQASPRV